MSNLSLKFQPWRDGTVVEELRRAFYPQKDTWPDKRREACDTVTMWRRRTNIPHNIGSTATLIEAQLHDNPDINSVEAIRATYAEAFARFVTGLTDIQQIRTKKRSMYALGRHINLPKSFVDLRHQITHDEEMPSLTVLREFTKRALRWLYIDYWEGLKVPEATINKFGDLNEELRDIQLESAEAVQLMGVEQPMPHGTKLELPDWTVSDQAGYIPRTIARNVINWQPQPNIRLKGAFNKLPFTRAMHIQSIPMWVGSSNNYAYLVVDDKSKDAVIIDPANPSEVTPVLKEQVDAGKINLTAIINTHHHWDHSHGNSQILEHFTGLSVIGGKDCQAVSRTPKDGETFKIGEGISVKALHTPCHTQDSICWYMEDGNDRAVFTGDTLFIGGCGRFFEGTAAEMHNALNKTLAALPNDTKVYPGHEYTKQNVKFLTTVLQNDAVKKLQSFAENNKETQGKFTIGDEKQYNAFMMVDDPSIQKATGKTDPVDVMGKLREMKNNM